MKIASHGGLGFNLLTLLLSAHLIHCSEECNLSRAHVAIIGGGVGGASAAYFLKQELDDIDIDIFEAEKVGGRTTALNIDGRVVEMGASIVHNQNLHFKQLAHAMGLMLVEPGSGDTERLFSIYNGHEIVFKQSSWTFITISRMLWRYGLSYFTFRKAPSKMLDKFLETYTMQEAGQAFQTPEEWLQRIGLFNLTQTSMRAEAQEILGMGNSASHFTAEFIAGINHVNYNQNNSLNALAGMVSVLPTVDSNLKAIKGGNYQLAERLIEASNASLHMPVTVQSITRKQNEFVLSFGEESKAYAAVIIASPLELNGLKLNLDYLPQIPPRKFQVTVTTLLRGRLRRNFFGRKTPPAGDYILVAEGSHSPFSVISPLKDYQDGTLLYKVFSEAVLSDDLKGALFSNSSVVAEHFWHAYPRFHPPESFAPFQLTNGLFYNNAIETAASAMEMSLIAAKNNALLAAKHLATLSTVNNQYCHP